MQRLELEGEGTGEHATCGRCFVYYCLPAAEETRKMIIVVSD